MRPRSEVAVVIPTLNGGTALAALLDAVDGQTGPFHPHIVAVDSGSTDGTLALLTRRAATLLHVTPDAFNHGETRNQALRAVDTELAVMIVQDALPTSPRWLETLVRPLCDDTSLAGTWARQRPRPDASRLTAFYLSQWVGAQPDGRIVGPVTALSLAAMEPAQRHLLCAFDNVCACIRMSVWRQHPFRRTRIAEDLEWALSVLQAGHRIAYVPDAEVVHSHDRTAVYELRRTYLVHQRLQALFGLSTIPDAPALVRAIALTLPLHLRLAAGERRGRLGALARAVRLAIALPVGQYLGARSARERREFLQVRGV
jgi:rhamnosyltransferase